MCPFGMSMRVRPWIFIMMKLFCIICVHTKKPLCALCAIFMRARIIWLVNHMTFKKISLDCVVVLL